MNTPEYIDDMICLLQELKKAAEASTNSDVVDEAIRAMKAHESEIEYYINCLTELEKRK